MAHPKINIRALQAFVAVYEEQSFSLAAERENATQSGMSTQVKNLELALNTKDLTGTVTGLIRFGMIPSLNRAVLPPTIRAFREQHPNVEVSVLEEYSYSLMRRVGEGDLDFAVVPAGDVLGGLSSSFIGRDRELLVANASHFSDLPQLSTIPPTALNGLNLIVPSTLNIRRQQLETYFNAHGVRLGSILEMDGMLATLEFVATTDWCAVLPSTLCHPDQNGAVRKLHPLGDPPMTTDYIVVQKSAKALTQGATLLVEQIKAETAQILSDWPDAKMTKP